MRCGERQTKRTAARPRKIRRKKKRTRLHHGAGALWCGEERGRRGGGVRVGIFYGRRRRAWRHEAGAPRALRATPASTRQCLLLLEQTLERRRKNLQSRPRMPSMPPAARQYCRAARRGPRSPDPDPPIRARPPTRMRMCRRPSPRQPRAEAPGTGTRPQARKRLPPARRASRPTRAGQRHAAAAHRRDFATPAALTSSRQWTDDELRPPSHPPGPATAPSPPPPPPPTSPCPRPSPDPDARRLRVAACRRHCRAQQGRRPATRREPRPPVASRGRSVARPPVAPVGPAQPAPGAAPLARPATHAPLHLVSPGRPGVRPRVQGPSNAAAPTPSVAVLVRRSVKRPPVGEQAREASFDLAPPRLKRQAPRPLGLVCSPARPGKVRRLLSTRPPASATACSRRLKMQPHLSSKHASCWLARLRAAAASVAKNRTRKTRVLMLFPCPPLAGTTSQAGPRAERQPLNLVLLVISPYRASRHWRPAGHERPMHLAQPRHATTPCHAYEHCRRPPRAGVETRPPTFCQGSEHGAPTCPARRAAFRVSPCPTPGPRAS